MSEKGSLTALVSCFARGFHTLNNSQPVFEDPMANALLRNEEKQMIAANWAKAIAFFDPEKSRTLKTLDEKLAWVMNTQTVPQLVSRARYTEDGLVAAINRGVRQYVILGAGLDTFVWRQVELPEDFIVFEVDHPSTQAFKMNRIHEMGITIPKNVRYVSVDFKTESLRDELLKSGFDHEKLAFYSLLGVVMYLDKADFFRLLSAVSEISLPGSSFVFDYLDHTAFNEETASKRMTQMQQITAQTGERMKTGFDPFELDLELQDTGMLLYENLSPEIIEDTFFKNRNDELHAFDHFHFAHLVVRG